MGCPAEVEIGDNLVFSICTHDPDTGVLTDATGNPAYRVYEDETGTAILTGSMAKLDDANTTGFYTESIACTGANGFENGKTYTVYITATVDGDEGGISYGFKAYDVRKSNVTQVHDDATAAANLESACDNYSATRGLAGTALPAVAAEAAGGLITRGTGAGQLSVTGGRANSDVIQISGDAAAANNAESFFDGTGYAGTNNVIPTVTNVTNLHASAATAAALATVDTNVNTLLTRITSTIFSGITSLAEWLGMLAGKQAGDATALTELRGTGAGSGTFDPTTDSEEALRDHIGNGSNFTGIASVGAVAGAVGSVTGNVGGSVGSVTGAVGSVTGNVGGNVVGSVGSVTGTVSANMTQVAGSSAAATNLERSALGLVRASVSDASPTDTSCVTDLTETTNDHYKGRVMIFTSGNVAGQATDITAYNGTTKALTYTALTEAPDDGAEFVIA